MKKKSITHKTTLQHFEVFKEECLFWIKYFGLNKFRVEFEHKDISGNRAMADSVSIPNFTAMLYLGKSWGDDEVTDYRIKSSAFHEVVELILWELSDMAYTACGKHNETRETHRVIRILENTVFAESYQRRFGGRKKL